MDRLIVLVDKKIDMSNNPDTIFIMTEHRKSIVVKSNALIESMTDMNLQEMRFLAFAAAQLPHDLVPEKGKPYDMEIDVQSFAETFEIEPTNAYRDIKKLADRLIQKIVEFDDEDGYEVGVGLLSKRKYHHGEGRLWFRFDEDLLPHLMGLTESFTQYRLKDVYSFTRPSTWRLYELLRQYKKIGKREIDLQDLHWKLGVKGKYPRPIDLRKRILDPAKAEINATSDIKVEYEQRKRGRRIVGFTFHIIENQDTKTPREKVREKVEKVSGDKALWPEMELVLRDEYRVNAKQARLLANTFDRHRAELEKKLPTLKKRWEKLPATNPTTGNARTSLGGYVWNALNGELQQGTLI